MTTPRDNDPILVGVGQETFRGQEPESALEPVEMMALAARKAEEDAETKGLLARVDSVRVVNVLSWRYSDAAGLLAEQVGASPREKLYTTMGGNTPQWLVNETAAAIASGEVGIALLAGAEALDTIRRARKAERTRRPGRGCRAQGRPAGIAGSAARAGPGAARGRRTAPPHRAAPLREWRSLGVS